MSNERSGFSSRLGFVLATAGSAVGLGNIWRFPYLAAKYGGGTFLLTYLILTLTFGFSLMITEVALGRKEPVRSVHLDTLARSIHLSDILQRLFRLLSSRTTVLSVDGLQNMH